MTDTRKHIRDFAAEVRFTAHRDSLSVRDQEDEWRARSAKWACTIKRNGTTGAGSRITLPFYMGSGHGDTPPTCEEVLECIASDAASVDTEYGSPDFQSWADEMGLSDDSRKAEALYRACCSMRDRLRRFWNDDYAAFIEAERD
jgi:hypothetical protein